MRKLKSVSLALILLLLTFSTGTLAQSKWTGTIEIEEFAVPGWVGEMLQERHPDITKVPVDTILAVLMQEDPNVKREITIASINSDGDFATIMTRPSDSGSGRRGQSRLSSGGSGSTRKEKFVFNRSTETFAVVHYNEKMVSKGTKADIQAVTKQASGAAREMEKRMADALKNSGLTDEQKKHIPGLGGMTKGDEPTLEETGPEKILLDRKVKFFKVRVGDEATGFWAACDDHDLAATFHEASQAFENMSSMGAQEKSARDAIPKEYYPVASVGVEMEYGMISRIKVMRTISIKPGNPGGEPFVIPTEKDGFRVMNMADSYRSMKF